MARPGIMISPGQIHYLQGKIREAIAQISRTECSYIQSVKALTEIYTITESLKNSSNHKGPKSDENYQVIHT